MRLKKNDPVNSVSLSFSSGIVQSSLTNSVLLKLTSKTPSLGGVDLCVRCTEP